MYQLTDLQKKIIDFKGKNILKACPGAGKTFVVAHKVIKDLELWKEKNKGMAILSFTNVASKELDSKIKEISGLRSLPYPHYIGTLDSFISKYIFMPFAYKVMKCKTRPTIVRDEFIELCSKKLWKRECYNNGCNPTDFFVACGKLKTESKGKMNSCLITETNKRPCLVLKQRLFANGYASNKEALLIAIQLLESEPELLKLLVSRFPYFIVDEAQDTSKEQMLLLNLLFEGGVENVMLIGDPDQAIYEWRDADPSVFLDIYNQGIRKSSEMNENFRCVQNSWKSSEMNENFRCSQNICNATKIFSSLSQISCAIGETKDYPLKPIIIKYENDERDKVIDRFVKLCDDNQIKCTPENVAVLTRGRSGLLGKDYSQIENLWKNEITSMLALATYYKGIHEMGKLISLSERILYYCIFGKYVENIDKSEVMKKYDLKKWTLLSYELAIKLPSSKLALKDWKINIVEAMDHFVKANNIELKEEVKIETKTRVKKTELKDFLEQSIESFFTDAYKTDKYMNTTIHSVKGRTFDAVMLIVGVRGKLTSNMLNTKEIDSEVIRTFYVAATRARKLFVLALPSTVKNKSLIRFPENLWDYK